MFLVFVIAETCDCYCEISGPCGGDCFAFEVLDDRSDAKTFIDLFPIPYEEQSGSKEKQQNRARAPMTCRSWW